MRALGRWEPAAARLALGDDRSPLATLIRLFQLGDAVDAPLAAEAMSAAGSCLLDRSGDAVRAAYDLAPYADETHDWYVVSDRTGPRGAPLRRDHVLGVGGASTTLAQLTVRRAVARALDVGTGCGVQSLHLGTHCRQVTGTDVVPRALQLAATTAALSGTAVELLDGDLTAPVADREFDLVVCNPPFVVGPAARFAYRDAGLDGDAMSRRAVRSCAHVLADGGVAQLLVNWLHVTGEDWRDRVASWVGDLGVDAWLLQRDVSEPADYVHTWLDDAGEPPDGALAEQWLTWFARSGVEAVGSGWVVARRGAGPHRVAVEELGQAVSQPLGGAIDGWLERTGWLRDRSDEAVLEHRFRAAPDVRLDVASTPGGTGWAEAGRALSLDSGFRWVMPSDEATTALVVGCDGRRPLMAVVAVLAAATGLPVDTVAAAACDAVRGLVDRGILLP
jgi:methylase of polypeptide subunit release factors